MKIAIIHFRIGLTDGVSLQIDERIRILKVLGHEVVTIAGTNSPISDLKIPYFEYKKYPDIIKIQNTIFFNEARYDVFRRPNAEHIFASIEAISIQIKKKLEQFWQKEKFSHIFIHNIFSLPVCIPASTAMYDFLQIHPDIKGIAVHHDFWWDPPRKNKFKVQNSKFKVFLDKYFPPILPNLAHTVISKWEREELKKRRGIGSVVITDTYDFGMKQWTRNDENRNYLADIGADQSNLKILCASRIRPRKGIELAIEFAHMVNRQIQKSQIPNYKKTVLILPGEYGEKELEYVNLLKQKVNKLQVDVCWIKDFIGSEEEVRLGLKKYSLWDTYVYSDAVIYPSLWEGFGNQFLEGVFARKLIVVFEYAVFKTDINPVGFQVVSLGDRYTEGDGGLAKISDEVVTSASQELISLLKDNIRKEQIVEHNFLIGKERFSTPVVLKDHLEKILK